MITIRKSEERGRSHEDWLDSRHTFSFAGYHDADWMGFRALRVINEDHVRPASGFGTHSHQEMEIVTYIVDGELEHKDSLGNGSVLRAGDVQRMTAGRGIRHSEMNPSRDRPVHLLQIWIEPQERGLDPGYEERNFPPDGKRGRLQLLASSQGRDDSLVIHQDVGIYAGVLEPGMHVEHDLRPERHAWIQLIRGTLDVSGTRLREGDGAALAGEAGLVLAGVDPAELLLFDLA